MEAIQVVFEELRKKGKFCSVLRLRILISSAHCELISAATVFINHCAVRPQGTWTGWTKTSLGV